MDKSQAIINFLKTCPTIANNPLFFNFGKVDNNVNQAMIKADDKTLQKPFIDGSVEKLYTFNIDSFKSASYNPVIDNRNDENSEDFKQVQEVMDWINEQGNNRNFPNFGIDCFIDSMETTTEKPELLIVDAQKNPPTAVYRITVKIIYIDNSKRIWD